MNKTKLAFKLLDMGLNAETLASLTESQLRLLYSKLNENKKESKEGTTYTEYSNDELNQGVDIDSKAKVTRTPTGVKVQHDEMKEGKRKSKKYNPWAICTAEVGRKDKKKYERCVMDVKKSIKEGKDPVNLFLEEKIVSLLERHIQPKITKREFLQMIFETQTKEKEKTKEKDVPTKPGKPGKSTPYRPKHKDAPAAVNEFLDTETAPTKPKERETIKPGKPDKSTPYRPKHRPAPQASNNKIQNLFPWDEVSKIARNKGLGFITQYIK